MIDWGFESPLFMARAVISNAPAPYLRKAVDELLKAAWEKDTACIPIDEVFDRLVQVSSVGSFTPSEIPSSMVADTAVELSEADEAIVKGFNETLEKIPEFDPENPAKWMKDLLGDAEEEDGEKDE